ncbi:hypothetical protein HHI36_012782 [Cryptolaemus montrouzieri]|uniref:Uncharacterized protein n=1 Tax=Cryptolaemus montrouzieri TaxID=559131 RepID=A0ABD2NFT3_9CUCU
MTQKLQVDYDLSEKNDILYYRDLNEKITNTFIENLNKVNWDNINDSEVQVVYEVFHRIIMKRFSDTFPLKKNNKVRKVKIKVAENSDLEQLKNRVEAAETNHRVNKDEISRDIHRMLRKQYKTTIDSEIRRTHLEKIKSSTNIQKTTWRVINANIKERKFKDMECTVDEFNKFFNVSLLLTPTVADTQKCMKYVRNIHSAMDSCS